MKIRHTRDTLSQTYLDAVKIRNTVFVKEQKVPLALEIDSHETDCVHFVLYNQTNDACATLRLLEEEPQTIILQRMAVLQENRGLGYAKDLVQDALKFATKMNYKTMILHAQLPARDFYSKLGFTSYGEIFEEAGIKHISMKKELKS